MEKRFAEVLSIPELNAWSEVFEENEQMPGRQNKYQHMLDRTFLRPSPMRFSAHSRKKGLKISRTADLKHVLRIAHRNDHCAGQHASRPPRPMAGSHPARSENRRWETRPGWTRARTPDGKPDLSGVWQ
jgi:hypothetical protein